MKNLRISQWCCCWTSSSHRSEGS